MQFNYHSGVLLTHRNLYTCFAKVYVEIYKCLQMNTCHTGNVQVILSNLPVYGTWYLILDLAIASQPCVYSYILTSLRIPCVFILEYNK